MAISGFERLHVYRLSGKLSDLIWEIVAGWNPFARNTVGAQFVRAADSVGANIAEGSGRGTHPDHRRFIRIARGSLLETRHWVQRAHVRQLLTDDEFEKLDTLLNELGPRLNAYLRSIGVPKQQRPHEVAKPPTDEVKGANNE